MSSAQDAGTGDRARNNAAGEDPAGKDPAGKEPAADENSMPESRPRRGPRRASAPATAERGLLPNKAAEDDPQGWGDRTDSYDHDAWLREQKPPHWG